MSSKMGEYKDRLEKIFEKMMYEDEFDWEPYEIQYEKEGIDEKDLKYNYEEMQNQGKIIRIK